MKKSVKYVLLVMVVVGLVVALFFSVNSKFFQGRFLKISDVPRVPVINPVGLVCSETDGGMDYGKKGVSSGFMMVGDGKKKFVVKADFCKGEELVEYYCESDLVKSMTVGCEEGKKCVYGSCQKWSEAPVMELKKQAGVSCKKNEECISSICASPPAMLMAAPKVCMSATCDDGVKNQDETGVDCGGVCSEKFGERCELGKKCESGNDCKSLYCDGSVCVEALSCLGEECLNAKGKVVPVMKSEEVIKDSKYDVYYLPGSSWRIVCRQPCPIPQELLEKKTQGTYVAIDKLLKLTDLDISEEYLPMNIHLTSDLACGDYEDIKKKQGYVYRFFYTGKGKGSEVCLWEWDDDSIVLPLNPEYAEAEGQDAEENAKKLEAQLVLVHEYTHAILRNSLCISTESFAKAFSFYVSGVATGSYGPPTFSFITDACDHELDSESSPNIYNQCVQCGFSFDQVSALLQKINYVYFNGNGKSLEGDGKVGINQLVEIFDEITGEESCVVPWLPEGGEDFSKSC